MSRRVKLPSLQLRADVDVPAALLFSQTGSRGGKGAAGAGGRREAHRGTSMNYWRPNSNQADDVHMHMCTQLSTKTTKVAEGRAGWAGEPCGRGDMTSSATRGLTSLCCVSLCKKTVVRSWCSSVTHHGAARWMFKDPRKQVEPGGNLQYLAEVAVGVSGQKPLKGESSLR